MIPSDCPPVIGDGPTASQIPAGTSRLSSDIRDNSRRPAQRLRGPARSANQFDAIAARRGTTSGTVTPGGGRGGERRGILEFTVPAGECKRTGRRISPARSDAGAGEAKLELEN